MFLTTSKDYWLPSVRDYVDRHGGVPVWDNADFSLDDVGYWEARKVEASARARLRGILGYEIGGFLVLCVAAFVALGFHRRIHLKRTLIVGTVAAIFSALLITVFKAPQVHWLKVVDLRTAHFSMAYRLEILDTALREGLIDERQATASRRWLRQSASSTARQ